MKLRPISIKPLQTWNENKVGRWGKERFRIEKNCLEQMQNVSRLSHLTKLQCPSAYKRKDFANKRKHFAYKQKVFANKQQDFTYKRKAFADKKNPFV
jgi:hypothetical protein